MIKLEGQDIFLDAIKNNCNQLSNNMIEAVSFILTMIESENSSAIKSKKARLYANNIAEYLQSPDLKHYTAYDLCMKALGKDINVAQAAYIKSLLNMNLDTSESKIPAKISKKEITV